MSSAPFKFLHAADLHLDSPLCGLERYEGAPAEQIRSATRRALENLVRLAIEQQVQFVLLAGDQYDGDQDDYRTVLFFHQQMVKLREAGIRVIAVTGNHDAASRMTKHLRLPDNVRLLPTDRADSEALPDLNVMIHGRGFAKPAERDNFVTGYPRPEPGCFNIGLLHTSLDGREGHDPYAPCTLADLEQKGYDYWALGHIHKREEHLLGRCRVVFAGNLQGRHIRECGPKGCYLVTVHERRLMEAEFVPVDVFRWEECQVTAGGLIHAEEIVDHAAQRLAGKLAEHPDHPLAVRVIVSGSTAADAVIRSNSEKWAHELRAVAHQLAGGRLWLEKIQFRTTPLAAAAEFDGPLGELRSCLAEARGNPEQLAAWEGELADLRQFLRKRKLPEELLDRIGRPEWFAEALEGVEPLLAQRLQGTEAAP